MTEKIHLKNRFLNCHGLEVKALFSDNELGFLVVLVEKSTVFLSIVVLNVKGIVAKTSFKAGLVFADLSLNGFDCTVDSFSKGFTLKLATE